MSDDAPRLQQLREERRKVRDEVYALGVRLNAGERDVKPALDAAIRRSDELAAEILRLEAPPPLPRGRQSAPMYGPPPAPMYGPPAPSFSLRKLIGGLVSRLRGRR
jgi:hypothetical protein